MDSAARPCTKKRRMCREECPVHSRDTSGSYLVTSYQTQASLEFGSRNSRHHDDSGRLLDPKRLTDKSAMIDANDIVHPAHATEALNYFLPDPKFTLTEHLIFSLGYQEHPAKFGAIANFLVGRSMEDCVHHYYFHKVDGRFKNESRRQRYDRLEALQIDGAIRLPPRKELAMDSLPVWDIRLRGVRLQTLAETDAAEYHNNGRRKRNTTVRRKASDPTCGPSEEDLIHVIPIEVHIAELKRELGISAGTKLFAKMKPPSRWEREILPPPLHLNLLSQNFKHPFHMSSGDLMHWLRSDKVLPLIREWVTTVVYDKDLYPQLAAFLAQTSHPYLEQIHDIAYLARTYNLWTPPDLKIEHQAILLKCAQFAYRLGRANRDFFSDVTSYSYSEHDACSDAAFVLLFAFEDHKNKPEGFFSVLLKSELAWMVRPAVRKSWERIYGFEGEDLAEEVPGELKDEDEQRCYVALPHRGRPDWNAILEHEGQEGNPVDYVESKDLVDEEEDSDDMENFDEVVGAEEGKTAVEKNMARADNGLEV